MMGKRAWRAGDLLKPVKSRMYPRGLPLFKNAEVPHETRVTILFGLGMLLCVKRVRHRWGENVVSGGGVITMGLVLDNASQMVGWAELRFLKRMKSAK